MMEKINIHSSASLYIYKGEALSCCQGNVISLDYGEGIYYKVGVVGFVWI